MVSSPTVSPPGGAVIVDLAVEYRRHAERLIARYPHADMSRLDYTVLRDLAMRRPDATRQALSQALRLGSPNVARRKTNERWLTAYVEHTTTAVLLNPEVQRARAAYQREQGGRGRGPPKGWPALEPARADTLSFVCQKQRPMCTATRRTRPM